MRKLKLRLFPDRPGSRLTFSDISALWRKRRARFRDSSFPGRLRLQSAGYSCRTRDHQPGGQKRLSTPGHRRFPAPAGNAKARNLLSGSPGFEYCRKSAVQEIRISRTRISLRLLRKPEGNRHRHDDSPRFRACRAMCCAGLDRCVSDGRLFSFGRSSSSPFDFLDGSVSSSIGAFEFGLRRRVGLFGSPVSLSGRR